MPKVSKPSYVNYKGGLKCCATCVWWAGERKIEASLKQILVESKAKGRCGRPASAFGINPAGTCPKYEQHPAIKR